MKAEEVLLTDELVQEYCDKLVGKSNFILNDELKAILQDLLDKATPDIQRAERAKVLKEVWAKLAPHYIHEGEEGYITMTGNWFLSHESWQALGGEKG